MESNDPISSVLRHKQGEIFSVTPDSSVYDALHLMANKDIGALLVMSGAKLAGIVSERDYARKVILMGRSSRETRVAEIMAPAISISPDRSVHDCMRMMTDHKTRHLAVLKAGSVVGIVSIGDLVNWIITSQEETIQHLHEYIAGTYPR